MSQYGFNNAINKRKEYLRYWLNIISGDQIILLLGPILQLKLTKPNYIKIKITKEDLQPDKMKPNEYLY